MRGKAAYGFGSLCRYMNGVEILETLSANIKKYRKEKSWTQENLAEEAEMSVQAINFFEGKRRWPGEDSLSKIAAALGVEVYQLFIPQDKEPVAIKRTPDNEKIRAAIQKEVVEKSRRAINRLLDKLEG